MHSLALLCSVVVFLYFFSSSFMFVVRVSINQNFIELFSDYIVASAGFCWIKKKMTVFFFFVETELA